MQPAQRIKQSGMTLIEVAIALIIAGVMLGSALQLYNQNRDHIAKQITEQRMAYITGALSQYAETNYRIPCPARPDIVTSSFGVAEPAGREAWRFGTERNSNQATASTKPSAGNCATLGEERGLLPYQTLGISYEYAKDGWGNYFTYAVSPVFTQISDFGGMTIARDKTDQVHERCRTQGWIVNDHPVNAPKARFCCAQNTGGANYDQPTDLIIINKDNAQTITPTRDAFASGRYAELNYIIDNGATPQRHRPPVGNIEAPAFILISHGKNGNCAFLANDTTAQKLCIAGTETFNGDNNRNYRIGVQTPSAVDLFDDIVMWGTQHTLMAYNGGSSCNLP